MAIDIKYYPEDTNKDSGTLGIKLPMNAIDKKSGGTFSMSHTTEEQSISNFINLLLTKSGERYMQPEFGIGLQYRIFENNTSDLHTLISRDIHQQTKYWLPYIFIRDIDISDGSDLNILGSDSENAIHIKIAFKVTEQGANRAITIFRRAGAIDVSVN